MTPEAGFVVRCMAVRMIKDDPATYAAEVEITVPGGLSFIVRDVVLGTGEDGTRWVGWPRRQWTCQRTGEVRHIAYFQPDTGRELLVPQVQSEIEAKIAMAVRG
jgi:hypothetical protein